MPSLSKRNPCPYCRKFQHLDKCRESLPGCYIRLYAEGPCDHCKSQERGLCQITDSECKGHQYFLQAHPGVCSDCYKRTKRYTCNSKNENCLNKQQTAGQEALAGSEVPLRLILTQVCEHCHRIGGRWDCCDVTDSGCHVKLHNDRLGKSSHTASNGASPRMIAVVPGLSYSTELDPGWQLFANQKRELFNGHWKTMRRSVPLIFRESDPNPKSLEWCPEIALRRIERTIGPAGLSSWAEQNSNPSFQVLPYASLCEQPAESSLLHGLPSQSYEQAASYNIDVMRRAMPNQTRMTDWPSPTVEGRPPLRPSIGLSMTSSPSHARNASVAAAIENSGAATDDSAHFSMNEQEDRVTGENENDGDVFDERDHREDESTENQAVVSANMVQPGSGGSGVAQGPVYMPTHGFKAINLAPDWKGRKPGPVYVWEKKSVGKNPKRSHEGQISPSKKSKGKQPAQ